MTSSNIRLGSRFGGRQAPRRESIFTVRYGRVEFAATVVALLYAAAAVYLVRSLGLTTSEALVRTARTATLWSGFDVSLVGFGFDRPPLLTALTAPFAAFEGLRTNGLAGALATSLTAGVTVPVAYKVAREAGFVVPARIVFTAAFALHPLLVYSGAIGLPEALYAALVLLAIAEFSAWIDRRDVGSVVFAGVALGLAFFVRYNVVVLALVMAWGFWAVQAEEERRTREWEAAQANALAFLVPVVFVIGLWSLIAWFPRGDFLGYLDLARATTMLGNDDPGVIQRMADLRWNPLGVLAWVGGWTVLVAPASVLLTAGLAVFAAWERRRSEAVLAAVCAAVVLPEALALLGGWGQAHVPHLFAAVVPAFAIAAHRERRLTRGVPPDRYEGRRRRAQYLVAGGLALAALASVGTLALMPQTDPPAPALVSTVRAGLAPAEPPEDAQAMAAYIRENAGPGGVVADVNRHAQVMLLTGDFAHFQTEASRGDEATLYDPFEVAQFVLVRRAIAGQGPGRIEEAYDDLFTAGAASLTLAFEAGDYRLYAVTGPAIP